MRYIAIIFLFAYFSASAQNLQEKSEYVRSIIVKAENYLNHDIEYSLILADSAYKMAVLNNELNNQADASLVIGVALLELNNYNESIKYLKKAEELFSTFTDELSLAKAKIYLGRNSTQIGDFVSANAYFDKSFSILNGLANDSRYDKNNILKAFSNLYSFRGLLNKRLKNYAKSLEYFNKELEINLKIGDSLLIGNNYCDLGRIYLNFDTSKAGRDKALNYMITGYNIIVKYDKTKELANTYKKLGLFYSEIDDCKTAVNYFRKALELYKMFNDKQGMVVCYNNIGRAFYWTNQYQISLDYYRNAQDIVSQTNDFDNKIILFRFMSETFEKTNKYDSALYYYRLYDNLENYINEISKIRIIEETEKKYEIQEQKLKIFTLERQKDKLFSYFFAFGMLTTLLVVVLFYSRNKNKIRTHKILEEKNKELESMYEIVLNAKNQAENLVQTKENIMRNLSHELQTPFNIVFGYISLLKEELENSDKPKSIQYLNDLSFQLNTLYNLLNDVYEISKYESGETSLSLNTFILNDIVNSAYNKFLSSVKQKELSFQIIECGDILITSEPKILSRILDHVLDNAVKYTNNGNISIIMEYLDSSKKRIGLTIEDTGIGIDNEYLEKIFELFSQQDMSITRSYEGVGLGLYITKKFVSILGGEIKIKSIKGAGTKIIVYLNSEFYCYSVK